MHKPNLRITLIAIVAGLLAASCATAQIAADQPVKVYILAGQSNMVGIGQVTSGGTRWGSEFIDPVVSVYPGAYDPNTDYDKIEPIKTQVLEKFGGVHPTPYPGGGTQIVRGHVQMKATGVYEFRPGYGGSMNNVMTIDGKEVHRQSPGEKAKRSPIKLEAGKKVPFKIVYLTNNANGLGWHVRLDVPGTLQTAAVTQNKFPELIDSDGNWVSRDDVWYKGVVTATANKWLSVGCGAGGGQVGPELGFGWVLGDYHDQPVLILKASQGNRSLGWDFLPPGSERIEHEGYIYAGYKDSPARWEKGTKPEPINWYAGKQYDDCFTAAHDVLNKFDKNFPQWAGRGYEIAGFVWWQGHKDSGSAGASGELREESGSTDCGIAEGIRGPRRPVRGRHGGVPRLGLARAVQTDCRRPVGCQ
jgi:hypothetical protein